MIPHRIPNAVEVSSYSFVCDQVYCGYDWQLLFTYYGTCYDRKVSKQHYELQSVSLKNDSTGSA